MGLGMVVVLYGGGGRGEKGRHCTLLPILSSNNKEVYIDPTFSSNCNVFAYVSIFSFSFLFVILTSRNSKWFKLYPGKLYSFKFYLSLFGLQFLHNNSTFISLCKWTMVFAWSISLPFVIPQCNSSMLQFKMLRFVPTDATEFLKFNYTLFYPQLWHNNSSFIFLCKQPINFVLSMYCFFSVFFLDAILTSPRSKVYLGN